jgi:hypothetical protein
MTSEIMHRRRHRSLPFGDPHPHTDGVHFSPRKPTMSRKKKSANHLNARETFIESLNSDTLLYSSSDDEYVLSSAGIVDTKREKRWKRQRQRARWRKLKRQRRDQKKGIVGKNTIDLKDEEDAEENIVSSITEANKAPAARLRRYVWGHLDKARHFWIPSYIFDCLSSWTGSLHPRPAVANNENRDNRPKYATKLTSASAPTLPFIVSPADDNGIPQPALDNKWMLRPGRRHRRCHSEQPRSWREPSRGLWTLAEE